MKKTIQKTVPIILMVACGGMHLPVAVASKAMSDKEIRNMIVQMSLKEYDYLDERSCPINSERKMPTTTTKQNSQEVIKNAQAGFGSNFQGGTQYSGEVYPYDYARGYRESAYGGVQGNTLNGITTKETRSESRSDAPIIFKCDCPCPYSKDSNGKECGAASAYFILEEDEKPKCYPEDVKTYEINDFRSAHGIPYAN